MKFHIWSVIWTCKFECSIRYQDIRETLIIVLENQQDLNGSLALEKFIYIVSIKMERKRETFFDSNMLRYNHIFGSSTLATR